MPRSGLANRYAIARSGSRDRQAQPACERRPALAGRDGTCAGGIRSSGKANDAHALLISPIHDLPTQNGPPPAGAHRSALAHSICLALVLALIVLLRGGVAWAQQAPPPEGKTYAHRFETRAPEPSHTRLHAAREYTRLLPREGWKTSRSHPAEPGLVLAQSTPPRPDSPRSPAQPGSDATLADRDEESDNPFAAAPFAPMLGFESTANPVIRAQISPRRQTVLSAEIAGKIVAFNLREGDRFTAGERLIGLDCAAHAARRDRARAQEQATRRRLETAGRLDQLSSISRLEYDEAVAALAAAEAETKLAEIFVARCAIIAPYDGRVSERLAEPYQYVSEGEPLIAILGDRDLEIELIAPSQWLIWLRPGHVFTLRVDELADDVTAQVSRLGARVDPVSQSVKVFAAITDAPPGLMAGMSGLADLAPPSKATPPGEPDG